ncbi:MAG TPA: phosphotransferase [Pseudaminobacter sp.]|nr:phosphotransferase [Pseudaminobacter sp.]
MGDQSQGAPFSEAEAVGYLLSRRSIDTADIVTGGLLITQHVRRNRSIAVSASSGRGFFLKQSDPMQAVQTLYREVEMYAAFVASGSRFADEHLPKFHWFDADRAILALEYLENVETFGACIEYNDDMAVACATTLGQALARLHRGGAGRGRLIDAPKPWTAVLVTPGPEVFLQYSQAAIDVIKIIQSSPSLAARLGNLECPPAEATLIHGDIRWDNILVRSEAEGRVPERLYIVDWEIAGAGDPARDIGGVFSEYLGAWIRSIPVSPETQPRDALGLAPRGLEVFQHGITQFWNVYCDCSPTGTDRSALLIRAVEVCGSRLVQSAFELAQSSARLSGSAVFMLQVAENVLCDPGRACRDLLSVPCR